MAGMDGFEPAPPSSFDWGSDDEGEEGDADGSDLAVPSFAAAKGGLGRLASDLCCIAKRDKLQFAD